MAEIEHTKVPQFAILDYEEDWYSEHLFPDFIPTKKSPETGIYFIPEPMCELLLTMIE